MGRENYFQLSDRSAKYAGEGLTPHKVGLKSAPNYNKVYTAMYAK